MTVNNENSKIISSMNAIHNVSVAVLYAAYVRVRLIIGLSLQYFKCLPEDPVPVLEQRFGQVCGHFRVRIALYLLLSQ